MGKATIIEAQNSNTVFEDGTQKGILGKLKGIFADFRNGTRNSDRLYSEELWDNRVFGNEDVMEALETKTLFGELDHPEGDRCETLAKNAAISIVKLEKKPEEGVIYGEAEILDTPTGRILKSLADSGAKLGVSSRGMGEEIYSEGRNIIDPETYDFITFDVVVTPANTKARVSLTESKRLTKLTENLQKEIEDSETENQLDQIKKVIENINISDKDNLLKLIDTKIQEKEPKVENKLLEANKRIALELMQNRMVEKSKQLENLEKSNKELLEANRKLMEEKEFYNSSKQIIKEKLKESISSNYNSKSRIENLEKELEANRKLMESKNTEMRAISENHKSVIINLNKINAKKLEEKEILLQEETKKLQEKLDVANSSLKKLSEANIKLSKKSEDYSKIILENKELKVKLETEQAANSKKLLESKTISNTKIQTLEAKLKALQSENRKMQELEEKYSKLDFNPVGLVKVKAENFRSNDEYDDDDIALLNVLANK